MSPPLVPLGTVLQAIEAGTSFKAFPRPAEAGEFGVLKLSAITWGTFRSHENKALPPGLDLSGIPTVRAGDLLISRANTTELVGAVAIPESDYPTLILSDKTLRLVPIPGRSDARYLYYALRLPAAREHIEARATGTSGSMRNISQDSIRTIPIPLPPLPEQRHIAAILDEADALRRKRQEALSLLDQLLHSTFLEMFGDIPAHQSRWPWGTCAAAVTMSSGKSPKDVIAPAATTIPIYGGNGVNGYADVALFNEPVIVVGRVGQQCGITHLTNGPAWVTDNAIVVQVSDRERLDPVYLATAFQHSPIRDVVARLDLPFINQEMLRAQPIPMPAIGEQRRFKHIRATLQAEHDRHMTALASSDTLFASLLHRAFAGEL